ncbi:hypothetical protein CDAR_26271 [Caerostris darwini]|uniref:Uncharacterized protein n=1 Tax=Caerostris darwini TaxID=1538125 RepID=A0AAV4N8A0_9ARAC|nr:hypothetical protein CDAR_26271 [Caerostris darwini]
MRNNEAPQDTQPVSELIWPALMVAANVISHELRGTTIISQVMPEPSLKPIEMQWWAWPSTAAPAMNMYGQSEQPPLGMQQKRGRNVGISNTRSDVANL